VLTGNSVTLTGNASFTTGGLANISSSRFFTIDGGSFGGVTTSTYQGTFSGNQTIFQATGTNA
jgi:hypothetical protein